MDRKMVQIVIHKANCVFYISTFNREPKTIVSCWNIFLNFLQENVYPSVNDLFETKGFVNSRLRLRHIASSFFKGYHNKDHSNLCLKYSNLEKKRQNSENFIAIDCMGN